MLVSGYLFYYSIKKYGFKENIKNRIKQLLIPIICQTLLEIVLIYFLDKTLVFSVSIFIYNLWFLWAVLFCSMIVLIVNKLFKDNLFVYIIIYCLLFFLPDLYNICLYSYMYIFFVLGYLFNKYNLKDSKYNNVNVIAIISTAMFLILLCFYNESAYIYTTGYYILKGNVVKQLIIDIYRTLIGLVGSISVISILKIINKKFKLKRLSYIGKYSLGIYIVSDLVFVNIFSKFEDYISNINYLLIIIEAIVVIVISIVISKLIQKNKLLNKLLLGGR
jgi:peptidoglycan/LPS O-acetylase OafA/YrhL